MPAAAPPQGKAAAKPVARKIVYTADVQIVVNDLAQAEQRLTKVVQQHDGYIAQSDLSGTAGQSRRGQWRIRVPVARFQSCLAELLQLGAPQKNGTDSKDVSEEYYDLEARVKNLKVEEARLQGYLEDKKATSKLEDILAIERELTRVRGEIEQSEGRRRMLGNLAELATISLALWEKKDAAPPEPTPEPPTFISQVAGTFTGSVGVLRDFGKGLVLVAAALAPWLPLLALVTLVLVLLVRRWRPARPPVAAVLPANASGMPGS
jgi:hypothetical protein